MTRVLAAFVLVTSGCAESVELVVGSENRIGVAWDDLHPDERIALEEAQGLLGVELIVVPTSRAYGRVIVDFIDAPVGGHRYPDSFCRRVLRVQRRGDNVAHELGHALGDLDHADDPANVMFRRYGEAEPGELSFTDDQLDAIHDGVASFGACR